MILAPSQDLLASLCDALPQVGVAVVGADGAVQTCHGALDAQAASGLLAAASAGEGQHDGSALLLRRLPDGSTLLVSSSASGASRAFVEHVLDLLVQKDQLELDMESMNQSSLQLLEQVAMLGETLPRLSAGESDQEIAALGVKACVVAAGVERAVYVRLHEVTGTCEVQVFVENDGIEQAAVKDYAAEEHLVAGEGLLAAVLGAGEGILMQQAGGLTARDPLGRLAQRELLGVPVTYGAGDKRVLLGALILFDKSSSFGVQQSLGSEEGQVAMSFASMLGAVLGARQTAALGKELSMAQAIQAQILPDRPAVVAGFDLAGDYRTSGEVGGDYFDYVPLADGRTLVVVADVSGHNLASGMMMVSARATLRTLAAVRSEPSRVFEDLATSVFEDLTRTERFITAAGVALAPGDRTVEIVNAGHNDLMLFRRRDGAVQRLPSRSTILGFLPESSYEGERIDLRPGDCLLLYTDGVTEAMDQHGAMFGEDRLERVLATAAADGSACDVVAAVLRAVEGFRGPFERGDDVTLVAIRALPQEGGSR